MSKPALLFFYLLIGLVTVNAKAQTISARDSSDVRKLLEDTEEYIARGENEKVSKIIEEAELLSDSLGYKYGKSLSILTRIDLLLTIGYADSALALGENFIENLPDKRLLIQFLNLQATGYRMKGEFHKSLDIYSQAIKEAETKDTTGNAKYKAAIKMNMAVVYGEIGEDNAMLENYLESLQFAEQADDSAFLVVILNNLGDTFVSFGEPDKAVTYLERGLEIAREIGSKVDELRILTNFANALTDLGELDRALDIYRQAFDLHKLIRPGVPPFILLHNMGNLSRQKEDFLEAERFFKESLAFSEDYGVEEGVYYNASALGELTSFNGQFQEAYSWYSTAFISAQKLRSIPFIADSYFNLYNTNKELGNYKEALQHFENYTQISDSLHNLEEEKALSDLKSTLELDRQIRLNEALQEQQLIKDQKLRFQVFALIASAISLILLLILIYYALRSKKAFKIKNLELKSTATQLEETLASRDHLMGVLAHDLRSPLATMQGLLDLISSDILTIDEIRELTKTIKPTLQKNSETIEGLLAWSQSQRNGLSLHLTDINLHQVIESVLDRQLYTIEKKKLHVKLELNHVPKAVGDENAVRMVLRNLLSNATKFTEKEGQITIRLFEGTDTKSVKVAIEDTGIGIPGELQKDMFTQNVQSRIGTNAEQGNGFGLSMCKAFIENMNGKIYFESEAGIGTTFYIELPTSQTH